MLSQRVLWTTFCEPRRGGNSDFAMTIWCFWISDCFVISLSICYWLFKCRVLRCERERERERQKTTARLQTHTSIITVYAMRLCSPLGLELMVKLRTLLTCLYIYLKAKARNYGKGVTFATSACGVRPITMHCASWPIRADCACRKEGLCRKRSVLREAGHRGPTIMYSIWKIRCFLNIKTCQHILLHQIHKIMIFKKHHMTPLRENC